MVSLSDQFRAEVETFLVQAGMEPSVLGRKAMKDPTFVFELRRGRDPSARTIDRVRAWMEAYRRDLAQRLERLGGPPPGSDAEEAAA